MLNACVIRTAPDGLLTGDARGELKTLRLARDLHRHAYAACRRAVAELAETVIPPAVGNAAHGKAAPMVSTRAEPRERKPTGDGHRGRNGAVAEEVVPP